MFDPTESTRRLLTATLNSAAGERAQLEARYGQVWDTEQLQADFDVQGFLAPYISVCRRSDGQRGLLMFQHRPRFYFSFEPVN